MDWIKKLKEYWLVDAGVLAAVSAGTTWKVCDQVLVRSRDDKIATLQSQLGAAAIPKLDFRPWEHTDGRLTETITHRFDFEVRRAWVEIVASFSNVEAVRVEEIRGREVKVFAQVTGTGRQFRYRVWAAPF